MLASNRQIRKDEAYLDFLRGKPCAFCGTPGRNTVHHTLSVRWKQAFRDDYTGVPACPICHEMVETFGLERTMKRFGMGPKDLPITVADLLVEYFQRALAVCGTEIVGLRARVKQVSG